MEEGILKITTQILNSRILCLIQSNDLPNFRDIQRINIKWKL